MHIALRSMKVQNAEGVVRHVKPGDKIPEAHGWKCRKAYEKRGWIALEGAAASEESIKAAMAGRDETIARLEGELAAEKLKTPGSESGDEVDDSADVEASTDAPSNDDSADVEAPKLSKAELDAMSKGSLQALADDLGINPDQSQKKLAKAILEAQ